MHLAKGLNFAVVPDKVPVVELITATESAIQNNKFPEAEDKQLCTKISMTLSSAKPLGNLGKQEKQAVTSLSKDHNITILPADNGRCTVVVNKEDYREKVFILLMYEQ